MRDKLSNGLAEALGIDENTAWRGFLAGKLIAFVLSGIGVLIGFQVMAITSNCLFIAGTLWI